MASIIRQAHHVARTTHHCYLCGHPIRAGERYLAVVFAGKPRDGWSGLRATKTCRHCRADELCACGECDYVVDAEPAEPIPDWLAEPAGRAALNGENNG